jgi:hypothetical protein
MNNVKRVLVLAMLLSISSSLALADNAGDLTVDWEKYGPEVKNLVDITPQNFKRASVLACVKRGWTVLSISDSKVSCSQKDVTATITMKDEIITVEGPASKANWLHNLRKDLEIVMLYLSE